MSLIGDILSQSEAIGNETQPGANNAERIGEILTSIGNVLASLASATENINLLRPITTIELEDVVPYDMEDITTYEDIFIFNGGDGSKCSVNLPAAINNNGKSTLLLNIGKNRLSFYCDDGDSIGGLSSIDIEAGANKRLCAIADTKWIVA